MDMGLERGNPGKGSGQSESIADEEFVARFEAGYRLFWTIAAGMTGDRSSADDIVYEAALQGLTRRDQFLQGTNFNAWMSQIVRFVSLNHVRNERKHRGSTQAESLGGLMTTLPDLRLNHDPMDPSDAICGNLPDTQPHFDDHVIAALNELSDIARVCLLLRTVIELSYAEIAVLLDIPQGTAMSHVHRSRKIMRDALSRGKETKPVGKECES